MKKLSGGCTLDCFDCCKFNVYVEEGKVVKIEGDKDHPYTKGFICKKGLAHLERQEHPNRQQKPLLKKDGVWQEITFQEALDLMADKLAFYKESAGNKSLLYYEEYGNGSLLKSIGGIFFNFYGGCARQKGGPCWSAGLEAQMQNFGEVKSHALEDMLHSKTIFIWGKNPAETTIHTMQMIRKAQKNGSFVVVIDPIKTKTAEQADLYIQVKPGGDGALALAMAKRIVERDLQDDTFIKQYVNGFESYEEYIKELNVNELCEVSGITLEKIDLLVDKYTKKYSAILLGYGLQKYSYSGNTIQLIDALAAITGQIGENGGGVNYANRVFPAVLNTDPYYSESYADNQEFYVSKLSSFLIDSKIKMAVIVKSNLMNQLPALGQLEEALRQVEFKVCFDQFLTDTAECCDLFIPATTVFESEDLLYSSMTNPYLTYIEKAVEPAHPLMDEYAFFSELAKKLNITEYPLVSKREYLTKVIEPLKRYDEKMSLQYLKDHYFTIHKAVAWADKKFLTKSGKIELIFNKSSLENKQPKLCEHQFRLITTHSKDTLFSQHFMDKEEVAKAYINENMAKTLGFAADEMVNLSTKSGSIQARIQIQEGISDHVIMMHVGWWKKHGNPNWILDSGISDLGGQVTYHENVVSIGCFSLYLTK